MHLAFVVQPLYGHVNPTLSLVEELVRRGNRVSYATGQELIPLVEKAGATGVGLPTTTHETGPTNSTVERFAELAHGIIQDAREHFPILQGYFEGNRPDAVCYDWVMFTGQMLVEMIGVPGVSLIPMFAANEKYSMTANGFKDIPPNIKTIMDEFDQERADFAAEHGVTSSLDKFGGKHVEALNLVFLPREFQLAADTFDDRFRFLGPMLDQSDTLGGWKPKLVDRPVLYIAMGTFFNRDASFYRLCIEAFRDSHWQVVMATGDHTRVEDLGDIPPNFDVRQWQPQVSVLRHADVHITHAGMNSVIGSLAHGVPMVTIPQSAEKMAIAARAEELRTALRLDPDQFTAQDLRDAVSRAATDDSIRASVETLQRVIRNCGGIAVGADAIEAHAARAGDTAQ